MLGEMGVQKFTTALTIDGGEPFYIVDSSFGWFIPEVFENQVGLDGGKKTPAWHLLKPDAPRQFKPSKTPVPSAAVFNLPTDEAKIFAKAPAGHQLQRRSAQCGYLDKVSFIPNSGKHGAGYAHGHKTVDVKDWFFSCHFWCDAVMPGSLGVESMHQALELFSVEHGFAAGITNARFEHNAGTTKWKYRGQLTPKNKVLECEVHLKSVEKGAGKATVIADGYLVVDSLRVYEVIDMRLDIVS